MSITRRSFLQGTGLLTASALMGCAQQFGGRESYLTKFIMPEKLNPVFLWTDIALQSVRDQAIVPPMASRALSLGPTAGFLAANGIIKKYNTHFDIGEAPQGAGPEVAYGVAYAVAAAEAFQQPFVFDRMRFLKQYPDSEAKSLGIQWGEHVGKFIVRERTNDGSEPSKANYYLGRYDRRKDPLGWTPTGPYYSTGAAGPAFASYDRGLLPGCGRVKPWTMSSSSQFRVSGFLDMQSPEFAEQIVKIREIGGAESQIRTADETEIAIFWEDGPWGITPPGHFTLIAMQILQHKNMSFIDLARGFALIGMTQCDAATSTWDSKYYHDILRPETAIRLRAEQFNNTDLRLVNDPNWRSLIPTPGFPSYTSGHSCFGSTGTRMTELLYGTDKVAFSGESPDQVIWPQIKGVKRHWHSLSQASEENGLSRIYGGVHWDVDNVEALRVGKEIADQAFNTMFPLKG